MASESYNKVAVVPYDMVNQLRNQQQIPNSLFIQPEVLHLQNLDKGIKNILFESSLAPDIKYKKYIELFNQYNTLLGNIRKPLEIEIRNKFPQSVKDSSTQSIVENMTNTETENIQANIEEEASTSATAPAKEIPNLQEIITNLPDKAQPLARDFVDSLRNNKNINWDSEGQIIVNNKTIEGSKISELIHDFMRERKNTKPGFDEVAWALKDSNFHK